MPSETHWVLEGRIIYTQAWGRLHYEDIQEADTVITGCLNTGIPLVHSLWIMSTDAALPNIRHTSDALRHLAHRSLGWTILVSSDDIQRFVATTVTQMAQARFRVMPTLEEALKFLGEVDSTLPTNLSVDDLASV